MNVSRAAQNETKQLQTHSEDNMISSDFMGTAVRLWDFFPNCFCLTLREWRKQMSVYHQRTEFPNQSQLQTKHCSTYLIWHTHELFDVIEYNVVVFLNIRSHVFHKSRCICLLFQKYEPWYLDFCYRFLCNNRLRFAMLVCILNI